MHRFVKATPLILVIVLLVSVSTGVSGPAATAYADSADRDALVALYNATAGANWVNNTRWLTAAPIGEWHGVTTDGDGRVVRVSIWNNQLTGSIPGELGSLSNLERLSLSFNELTGTIPTELGGLSNLESLDLSSNELTGTIPAGLGSLSNLESMSLSSNELTGSIPAELGGLANLKSLYLSFNELTGIPVELGSLSNLERLSLSFNELTGTIPTELGGLSNLESLDLSSNELTGSIPAGLGSLSNLESMSLSSNELTGSIPAELGGLANLKSLYLSFNELTGIPVELGSLSNLERLSLSFNELTGTIPTELGGLSNLESLDLSSNELTGSIPAELGGLANLKSLYLSSNELTGSIPAELSGLANLKSLYLSFNELTGCIPAGLRDVENNDLDRLGLPDCVGVTGPSAPQNLTATANGQTQIDLSWSAPSSDGGAAITGYRVEVSTDRTAWTDLAANTGSTRTSYSHTGLTAGTTRHYRVSAIDSGGPGHPSNVASATTTEAPAEPCLEIESLGALTVPATKMDVWGDDCDSEARPGSYARYYSFTLAEAGQVEINLTSSADPYLALRQGEGRDGVVVVENDNVGSRNFNSSINRVLAAGAYIVEATTYFAGQTGDFTLSVRPLQETEDLGDLTRSVDRSNSMWTSDHESTQQMGSYARSYAFTLTAATHVVINLTSPEDPYLFLLDTNGAVVHENDNVTTRNLNSRIDETIPAGTYTIEATTYFPARAGTFHLSIGYFGASGG